MARQSTKSANRYGVRYGRRNKERVQRAESGYKTRNKSPFCNKNSVKRLAAGIYMCLKTKRVFTGRAYTSNPTTVKK